MRCRKEDLGKWLLPWCLSPSSSSAVSSYGLFSAMWAEVAGAQRQVLSSFTGPGVQVKARDGGLPLLLPQYLSPAFLALQWNFLNYKVSSLDPWLRGQDETRCGRVTRHKGKMWYQLALEQEREIYICTDEISNSQSQSKTRGDFLWVLIFLCTSSLCTFGDSSLHCSQVRWSQGDSRAVYSSSSGTALSGSWHFDLNPKENPYMASQLLK